MPLFAQIKSDGAGKILLLFKYNTYFIALCNASYILNIYIIWLVIEPRAIMMMFRWQRCARTSKPKNEQHTQCLCGEDFASATFWAATAKHWLNVYYNTVCPKCTVTALLQFHPYFGTIRQHCHAKIRSFRNAQCINHQHFVSCGLSIQRMGL